jgi:hypothetical protein
MKKHILLFLSISAVLLSCATTKNTAETNTPPTPPVPPVPSEEQVVFQDLAEGDSLFAHIKKGYCFGTCPVYEMKIYNSGLVVLQGTQNIDLLGEQKTQLTKDEMLAFVEMAKSIKYFEMEDEYDNKGITDLPETITSIVINGKRKQVRKRYGYPRELVSFEDLFAALLESHEWNPGLAKE